MFKDLLSNVKNYSNFFILKKFDDGFDIIVPKRDNIYAVIKEVQGIIESDIDFSVGIKTTDYPSVLVVDKHTYLPVYEIDIKNNIEKFYNINCKEISKETFESIKDSEFLDFLVSEKEFKDNLINEVFEPFLSGFEAFSFNDNEDSENLEK